MPRKVMVCVDQSVHSTRALHWACANLVRRTGTGSADELHIATVTHSSPFNLACPMAPVATGAAVAAVTHQYEAQKRAEEIHAAEVLKEAVETATTEAKVPRSRVHTIALPATGGASGVAESLVEYARARGMSVVVLGCRGMGAITRSLMSLIGLGSVSDYCLHHMPCPVLLVRGDDKLLARQLPVRSDEAHPQPPTQRPKHLLVAVDDSPHASFALDWALDVVMAPHDHLHIATVAVQAPFPAMDEPGAAAAMEMSEFRDEQERAMAAATAVAERFEQAAQERGVPRSKVSSEVLKPNGGSSDIGAAISRYAKAKDVDVVVVGSRGMGAVARSMMGLLGLGSVSDYLAHNLPCPLLVVRQGHSARASADGSVDGTESLDTAANVNLRPIREGGEGGEGSEGNA